MGILQQVKITEKRDVWKWANDFNEGYSVKAVRMELAGMQNATRTEQHFVWNSWAPLKVNYLAWRAIEGKIASKIALTNRGCNFENLVCDRCGLYNEDTNHILVGCLWARTTWWHVCRWIDIQFPVAAESVKEILVYMQSQIGSRRWKKIINVAALATIWRLWEARNAMVFDGNFVPVKRIVENIKEDVYVWCTYRSNLKALAWEKWVEFEILELL
ncbi:uncharacterized protein LOC110944308 [Helianthus annuus]|uniref:uncharacterized protein LOC110944308 n=1 Tax=Helianthus annuus TaxID=4232 RepID=UPI000B8F3D0F|nr:uncharacterized protein LOC110944308 [Helianthus annuus]